LKTTTVTNLRTGDKSIFVNDLSLEENLINVMVANTQQMSNLLNVHVRTRLKKDFPINSAISTKTGKAFAYCELMELHAQSN